MYLWMPEILEGVKWFAIKGTWLQLLGYTLLDCHVPNFGMPEVQRFGVCLLTESRGENEELEWETNLIFELQNHTCGSLAKYVRD